MSADTVDPAPFDGDMVLVPAAGIAEAPVGDEVILWHPSAAVPLQLNPVATAIWWHFETAPLDEVVRDVAQYFSEPVERVAPSVQFVTRSLHDAGFLHTVGDQPDQEPAEASGVVEHRPSAQIGQSTAAWLKRRAVHRVSAQAGAVRFGVASNTRGLADRVSAVLGNRIEDDSGPAAVRYNLIDAGETGAGVRYWLVSDTGLPLERTDSPDDLVQRLALHVAELAALQHRGTGVPLRLGVLEASDHVVAVQWDLLATRPVLEAELSRLGYRIRSGQWAIVDPSDLSVRPGATVADADPAPAATTNLPLRGIVGWFGAGSLDVPVTHGEWAWTLAVYGCASIDPGTLDRPSLLEASVALADASSLRALSDPGPSALLQALTENSEMVP